jgi:hypothetical protein
MGTAGPFGSSVLVGSAAPFGSAAPVAIPYGTTRVPNTYGSAMPYSYGSAAPYGRSAAPYDGRSAAPYGSARPDSSKPIYPKGRADGCSTIQYNTLKNCVCVCLKCFLGSALPLFHLCAHIHIPFTDFMMMMPHTITYVQ